VGDTGRPTTALGNWYATVVFWKPQGALFVNERTLTPIVVPLAPAISVTDRFPAHLLGSMNEFVYLGKAFSADGRCYESVELSLELAKVPCRPLYGSHVSPDDELRAFVAALMD
jgi:hypothetical protein